MARTVALEKTDDVSSTGIVEFPNSVGGTVKKIPARGHDRWSLEVVTKTAAGGADVDLELRGTNNPDPTDVNGEALITVTNIATATTTHESTETSGNIRNAYKYVFVHVTTATDLVIDAIRVYGAGFSGQE